MTSRAAREAIRVTAARVAEDPTEYFTPNEQGRWQFIAVIRLLHLHGVDIGPFQPFYEAHFPGSPAPYRDLFYGIEYPDAVASTNYRSMGNHLTYASFLHFLLRDVADPGFPLPDDHFPEMLGALEDFTYPLGDTDGPELAEQDYFATHLAMMLTNWGEEDLMEGDLVGPLRAYVDSRFDTVRLGSDDFVLFAEFVEALRLLQLGGDSRIERGEAVLMARQHADGSWGAETASSLSEDPYSALHPTWAAMAALRHGR